MSPLLTPLLPPTLGWAPVLRRDGGSGPPPLTPTGDQARSQLREELLRPGYLDKNIVQRILDWLQRGLDHGAGSARHTPPLTWLAATVVVVALVVGIALLASRVRRTARAERERTAVIPGRGVTAADLRAAAERALAQGRYDDAVLDGFRALAVGEVERGRLPDDPGLTAHEVAGVLSSLGADTERTRALAAGADLFDATLYGGRRPSRAQAEAVLALHLVPAGRR